MDAEPWGYNDGEIVGDLANWHDYYASIFGDDGGAYDNIALDNLSYFESTNEKYKSFNDVVFKIVDDTSLFASYISGSDMEGCILLPCRDEGNVGINLMHCMFLQEEQTEMIVLGVRGYNFGSTWSFFKLSEATVLMKTNLSNKSSSEDVTTMVPLLDDFLAVKSEEDFASLTTCSDGKEPKPSFLLRKAPMVFIMMPILLKKYNIRNGMNVCLLGSCIVQDLKEWVGMLEEHSVYKDGNLLDAKTQYLLKLLQWLWMVSKGYAGNVTISDNTDLAVRLSDNNSIEITDHLSKAMRRAKQYAKSKPAVDAEKIEVQHHLKRKGPSEDTTRIHVNKNAKK